MDNREELIEIVAQAARDLNIDIMLIGAYARDYWAARFGLTGNIRTTYDIDFACQIFVWDDFNRFLTHLQAQYHLLSEPRKTHSLWLRQDISLDLVPCGGIADQNGIISWPPNYEKQLCVLGYDTAKEHAETVHFGKFSIKVMKPHWLAMLKMQSYIENPYEREKDLQDVYFIAKNYLECIDLEKRIYADNGIDRDILNMDSFDITVAGAVLAARDCRRDNPVITENIADRIKRFEDCDLPMAFSRCNKISLAFAKAIIAGLSESIGG